MNPERWDQIKQVYHAALDLEPGRREEFLKEACAGDESLFKEVTSLLSREGNSGGLFESPALDVVAKALAEDQAHKPEPNLVGQMLLHYRILEKIGVGGMGVVYRAEDTKLRRKVAIKFLPDQRSGDREQLARFKREAELLASLSHPNIAVIHGLQESDDTYFLDLELVEGKTLADQLEKGPLPLKQAIDICVQIAEGLEAAHERGIVHRDLKPGNVKVTSDGKVKILDFGLAKSFRNPAIEAEQPPSPVITDEMTRPGIIRGTAAYMSPEQAQGKTVDKRTDIWAFGCVLYNCLTGKRAFPGETVSETLASILKDEPDWEALPPAIPLTIRSLLHRCLRKDPRDRLHDIADARIELKEAFGKFTEVPAAGRVPIRMLIAAGTAILLVGLLIGVGVTRYFGSTNSRKSQPVARSSISLVPGHGLGSPESATGRPVWTDLAISKDGRLIVYSSAATKPGPQGKSQLYLRRSDQFEARPIGGTDGGCNPFLSPDDRWVGFWVDGELMKVAIDGGVPVHLCHVLFPFGASWGADNSIVFAPFENTGLFRISAEGGVPEVLTTPDKTKEERSHRLPHCLPDGKGVLFTILKEAFDLEPRIAWLDPGTRKWSVLMEDAADARYVPTGHLVFLRQGMLMAVEFNLERHQVTGQPVPAIANVMQALNSTQSWQNSAAGQFCISDSGSLVYAEGGILPEEQNSLVWVNHKGQSTPAMSIKAHFLAARLSPDGRRIAYWTFGRERAIWVYDLERGTVNLLTNKGRPAFLTWSPDGKRVVFGWSKTAPSNLYWQAADGSSAMERLTAGSDYTQYPGSWSPDGSTLAVVEVNPGTFWRIGMMDLRTRRITPFLKPVAIEEYDPEFSPDGRWIAYTTTESGRNEVYVRPYPGQGGKWLISREEGSDPLWARNGKQLFYRSNPSEDRQQVWIVDVRTDGGFSAGKPRLLFEGQRLNSCSPIRSWDLSLDSQRFLMVKGEETNLTPVNQLFLVQNWFEELKRLVPAK